jgi:hypothetical protein
LIVQAVPRALALEAFDGAAFVGGGPQILAVGRRGREIGEKLRVAAGGAEIVENDGFDLERSHDPRLQRTTRIFAAAITAYVRVSQLRSKVAGGKREGKVRDCHTGFAFR